MIRDHEKLLEEYRKLEESGKGIIYANDIKRIYDMCSGDYFDTLITSLKIGIAIGYRIAKHKKKN